MRKFKLGNFFWEYTPETNEFNSIDEAWNFLSNGFARSRTQDSNKEFKAYLYVYETNKYGFMEWALCKEGFAKHI